MKSSRRVWSWAMPTDLQLYMYLQSMDPYTLYFKITETLTNQFQLQHMHTSLDPSMTFNIVSNVFRIPMAVTAFSSLSSPSNSCTKVPACVNKFIIITNFFCTKAWRTQFGLYYNGNSRVGLFWGIFHRLCKGSSHIHVHLAAFTLTTACYSILAYHRIQSPTITTYSLVWDVLLAMQLSFIPKF